MDLVKKNIVEEIWKLVKEYQKEDIIQSIRLEARVLLAHDPGMGKTIISLLTMSCFPSEFPLYIFCPSSICGKWKKECIQWLQMKASRIHIIKDNVLPEEQLASVYIMSFDRARMLFEEGKMNGRRFRAAIVDECHKLKNTESKTTLALTPHLQKTRCCMMLSGTPAPNRTSDWYSIIRILRPQLFRDFWHFANRYCNPKPKYAGWPKRRVGTDTSGSSNLTELNQLLLRTMMIRRNRILEQKEMKLPDKTRTIVYIEPEPEKQEEIKTSLQEYDVKLLEYKPSSGSSSSNGESKDKSTSMAFLVASTPSTTFTSTFSLPMPSKVSESNKKETKTMTVVKKQDENKEFSKDVFMQREKKAEEPSLFDVQLDPFEQCFALQTNKKKKRKRVKEEEEEMKEMKEEKESTPVKKKSKTGKKEKQTAEEMFFDLVRKTVKLKIAPMTKYIEQVLGNMPIGKKAVLFGHHKFMLKALRKCVEKIKMNYILVNGSTTSQKRTEMFQQFQTDDQCRVAILSIKACETGIDLTAGSLVIFSELSYGYDSFFQGEARCHRIGQKEQVDVMFILLKGSVEERIWFLVQNKLTNAGLTLDNLNVSMKIEHVHHLGDSSTLV